MALTTALKIRLILGPLLISSILLPELYQPFLDRLWQGLLGWSLYNWSSFETIWTVFWYAIIEVSTTVIFLRRPELRFLPPSPPQPAAPLSSQDGGDVVIRETGEKRTGRGNVRIKGMRRPSRRIGEILTYIAPLLAMDLTMIKKFRDVEIERIIESGAYTLPTIPAVPIIPFSTTTAAMAINSSKFLPPKTFLIPTLHNFTLENPLQLFRALPFSPPSSRRLMTELIASFLIYDALFFLFHLALHMVPVLRKYHVPHHAHPQQINPQVTNQLSVLERLGLVMLANFSLNVLGAHVLTRTAFVVVFVWMLVEIHSGMDLGWGYEKVLLPKGWAHGARGHWRHHAGMGGELGDVGGYEPFFAWWDVAWAWWERRRMVKRGMVRADVEGIAMGI